MSISAVQEPSLSLPTGGLGRDWLRWQQLSGALPMAMGGLSRFGGLQLDFYYYSIFFKTQLMNFTILGRNSTAGPIYTDRPSHQYTPAPQSWKKPPYQPHHLNPSKSKLNVRNSLNKTNQNTCYSNHSIDNVRASCFVANPISTYQHIKKQSLMEEKTSKPTREPNQLSFELTSKESFYKCSSVTPTSLLGDEDRKKIESTFLRGSLKEGCTYKVQEDYQTSKESKMLEQMKSQIMALTKRVFINEQEICKLKEKKDKDKKVQTLQQEFTQFQIQMFDILKKNSNFFADFQSKIQKNSNLINELREKIFMHNGQEELYKKLSLCETKINELTELVKTKDENNSKAMVSLLSVQQTQIKGLINDQVYDIKLRLDKNAVQTNQILTKLSKLDEQVKASRTGQYIKDSRKCYNSMIIENKQVLIVRQNAMMKDNTKQHLNYQTTPKKDYHDHSSKYDTPRKENGQNSAQGKREIVLKQKIYYVDPQGYLLDQNKYYLLNSKNQQIMIPDHLLHSLRQNNILMNPPPAPLTNSLLIRR